MAAASAGDEAGRRFPFTWDGTGREPTESPWGECARSLTLGVVSLWAKAVLGIANSLNVASADHERFIRAVTERPPGQGLLTVSNHRSTLDDPVLFCALLPARFFFEEHLHRRNRWVLCAHTICHKNELLSNFFLAGKTLPVERGGGLAQPVMALVARQLARGDWVHVFPEGKVRQDGEMDPLKLGTAYLLCKAAEERRRAASAGGAEASSSVVLPFYHSGMERVKPLKQMLGAGHAVTLRVGEPVPLGDLLGRCGKRGQDQAKLYREITERIDKSLHALEGEERRAAAAGGGGAGGGGGAAGQQQQQRR